MLDLKIKKNQVGVLLALLAVVVVSAAIYVYRANIVSEGFDDSDGYDSDDDEVEGFESAFASV